MENHSAVESVRMPAAADSALIVRDLAHELRQPLGSAESIACYLNMVLDPGDGRARRHVRKIRQLVEQMACLLHAAVHLTQGKPGRAQVIDLHELALEELAEHVCESPWNCEMRLAREPALVNFDPDQLRHLIRCMALYCRRQAGDEQSIYFESEVAQRVVIMRFGVSGAPVERSHGTEMGDADGLAVRSAAEILRAQGGRLTIERQRDGGSRIEAVIPSGCWVSPILEATKSARASLE